jgi:hypothetical protein
MPDDYDFNERAAIMEYDGGLTRAEAELLSRTLEQRKSGVDPETSVELQTVVTENQVAK